MLNIRRNILIFIFIGIIFSAFASFALADRALEVSYPDIPNVIKPTTVKALLTDYIKYIFSFALMLAGFIAFGSLIYGGVLYASSAGSPGAINDAKSRMFAGILGLIVLFSSYLILTTVNPQLVILAPSVTTNWGVTIYKNSGCGGDSKEITKDTPDFGGGFQSFKFKVATPGMLDVNFFAGTYYAGDHQLISSGSADCLNTDRANSSVRFIWKLPGVYLVRNDGLEKFLPASTATVGDFNDRVWEIKFNNIAGVNYGAVLHENQDFKGECSVFTGSDNDFSDNVIGGRTSSVTTFIQSDQEIGDGVTFYKNDNFGDNIGTYKNTEVPSMGGNNDQVTSLEIQGNYIAILFEDGDYKKKCQVFTKSNANLRNEPMGRCGCGPFGWGCTDCLSSFKVYPTK
ncbi:MAG: hypothetical protein Q7R53_01060 [bacterium]|nr:hypothetical protein [bacterium]